MKMSYLIRVFVLIATYLVVSQGFAEPLPFDFRCTEVAQSFEEIKLASDWSGSEPSGTFVRPGTGVCWIRIATAPEVGNELSVRTRMQDISLFDAGGRHLAQGNRTERSTNSISTSSAFVFPGTREMESPIYFRLTPIAYYGYDLSVRVDTNEVSQLTEADRRKDLIYLAIVSVLVAVGLVLLVFAIVLKDMDYGLLAFYLLDTALVYFLSEGLYGVILTDVPALWFLSSAGYSVGNALFMASTARIGKFKDHSPRLNKLASYITAALVAITPFSSRYFSVIDFITTWLFIAFIVVGTIGTARGVVRGDRLNLFLLAGIILKGWFWVPRILGHYFDLPWLAQFSPAPTSWPDILQFLVMPFLFCYALAQRTLNLSTENAARKDAERNARNAQAIAEHQAKFRSDFLASMSHEIRTPLNGVLGTAQIGFRENAGRVRSQRHFSQILDSGKLLLTVVNDILDFSKIEAGKMSVEAIPHSPIALVEDAVIAVAPRAEAGNVALTSKIDADVPKGCLCDPVRITQILLNMLSNAVKFAKDGSVELHVYRDGNMLAFSVADNGIGMSSDQLSRLFRAFEQADKSTSRHYGGTGLGLAISRNLAELMGGSIEVSSQLGVGSRFVLTLPCHEVDPPVESTESLLHPLAGAFRLDGKKILGADDNEVNRLVLQDMLASEGASVTVVSNGKLALEEVEARPGYFDAVLLDVEMPEMDGLEATRRIQRIEPNTPVIGQTAHALLEQHERCLEAGMVETITKPIDHEILVLTVLKHARRHGSSEGSELSSRRVRTTYDEPGARSLALAELGTLTSIPELDVAAGLRLVGGQTNLYVRLLDRFCLGQGSFGSALDSAIEANDIETALRLLHSLKGVSGQIGAKKLTTLAASLENEIRLNGLVLGGPQLRKDTTQALKSLIAGIEAALPITIGKVEKELVDSATMVEFLTDLSQLLITQDFKALEAVAENQALLLEVLGENYPRFAAAIRSLDFDAANSQLDIVLDKLTSNHVS